MPKIILDRKKCIQCGACAAIAPELFEMAQDGKSTLKKAKKALNEVEELEITADKLKLAKETAEACPNSAITVEE